jgi:hypothetical protein
VSCAQGLRTHNFAQQLLAEKVNDHGDFAMILENLFTEKEVELISSIALIT